MHVCMVVEQSAVSTRNVAFSYRYKTRCSAWRYATSSSENDLIDLSGMSATTTPAPSLLSRLAPWYITKACITHLDGPDVQYRTCCCPHPAPLPPKFRMSKHPLAKPSHSTIPLVGSIPNGWVRCRQHLSAHGRLWQYRLQHHESSRSKGKHCKVTGCAYLRHDASSSVG